MNDDFIVLDGIKKQNALIARFQLGEIKPKDFAMQSETIWKQALNKFLIKGR